MTWIDYLLTTAFLLAGEVLYLYVARYVGIVDVPNERSLHTNRTTIRGGGVVFWLAAWMQFLYSGFEPVYFFAGLSLIAVVSFWDDVRTLTWQSRISAQCIAVGGLLYPTVDIWAGFWLFALVLIVGVGILNAFNFMDGINGMTAFYGLVTIGTLWYGRQTYPASDAADSLLLSLTILALLIFGFFNARPQAICFAGDVGSISIGFISLYALIRFVVASQSFLPVLFLAVYGIDSVLTISYRIYRRQAIFKAHRLHLFQCLVYEQKWPHLLVAALYALVQLGINGLVLGALSRSTGDQWMLATAILGLLTGVYGAVRWQIVQTQKRVGSSEPTP